MKTHLFFLLFSLLLASPLAAGTVAEARFRSPGLKASGSNLKLSLQESRLRLDLKAYPVDGTFLYDRSTGILTVVDHYAKSYEEFGAAKRFFLGKTLQIGMGAYETRLDKASPDQQQAWGQLRTAVRAVFTASFEPSGTIQVAGITGSRYVSKTGKIQSLSLVMAPPERVSLGPGEWETWKEFCALLRDGLGGGLTYFGADPDKLAIWPGVPGFPLEAAWKDGSKKMFKVEVEAFRSLALPDKAFSLPTGYQAASLIDSL